MRPKTSLEKQVKPSSGQRRGGEDHHTQGDTNSRVASRGQLKQSESQILNDTELWNMSDSDGDFQEANQASGSDGELDTPKQKGGDTRDEEAAATEMARYLVERAPMIGTPQPGDTVDTLWRKTAQERTLILRREQAIKGLCELCVLRCLRPDHLQEGLDRFVATVVDTNYFDFRLDILPKWSKTGAGKGDSPQKGLMRQGTMAKKLNATTSGMSKTMQSKESSQQNKTAGSKMHDTKSNAGGVSQASSGTGRAQPEQ